jgi:hypothetical protein
MVQEAFAASAAPHVLVWVKPALGTMFNGMALVPRLVTVKALAALGDPTATFPNATVAGLRDTGAMPDPVMALLSGLPTPL